MPFCTQCGKQVRAEDVFCDRCGTRQTPSAPKSNTNTFRGISPRTASMLCYIPVLGWLASVVILATPHFREDRVVRFHAFQGLYLFVVWLIIDMVIAPTFEALPGPNPMRPMLRLMHAVLIGAWVWMIVKTAQEQMYHLPLVGELAERSLAEQR